MDVCQDCKIREGILWKDSSISEGTERMKIKTIMLRLANLTQFREAGVQKLGKGQSREMKLESQVGHAMLAR